MRTRRVVVILLLVLWVAAPAQAEETCQECQEGEHTGDTGDGGTADSGGNETADSGGNETAGDTSGDGDPVNLETSGTQTQSSEDKENTSEGKTEDGRSGPCQVAAWDIYRPQDTVIDPDGCFGRTVRKFIPII